MVDDMIYKDNSFQEFFFFQLRFSKGLISIRNISFRILSKYIPVKSRKVSYLFVENFSKIGKDLRLPWMHHPGNGRNVHHTKD
jgi:hypothetical protein